MLLVDANVLLHAVNEDAREHETARRWLEESLGGREALAFSWVVLLAFLRIATHPSAFARPLAAGAAGDVADAWLGHRAAIVVEPTRRHLPLLKGLLGRTGTAGNLVSDAHLAALSLEHGATIVSFDRDFGRFEGISWSPPAGRGDG